MSNRTAKNFNIKPFVACRTLPTNSALTRKVVIGLILKWFNRTKFVKILHCKL